MTNDIQCQGLTKYQINSLNFVSSVLSDSSYYFSIEKVSNLNSDIWGKYTLKLEVCRKLIIYFYDNGGDAWLDGKCIWRAEIDDYNSVEVILEEVKKKFPFWLKRINY